MPSLISQNQNVRGIRWRGVAATVVVELLVLLALGVAVVRYLEWSSETNQAEFMSATNPSASDPRVCVSREAERLRRRRDGVTVVHLLRSAEYQFCKCGVF
jgi:hypothetical protein